MAARRAAEEAGRDGSKAAQAASFTGISLQEAQQILNIKDIDDIDIIRKVSIIIDDLEHDIWYSTYSHRIMNIYLKWMTKHQEAPSTYSPRY